MLRLEKINKLVQKSTFSSATLMNTIFHTDYRTQNSTSFEYKQLRYLRRGASKGSQDLMNHGLKKQLNI